MGAVLQTNPVNGIFIYMEIWKLITGLENHYISNYGRVKADTCKTKFGNQIKQWPERFINPWVSRTGYNYIDISINGKVQRFLLHRLVALHFIDNIDNKPHINHIDGDKNNNNVSNLEWCTEKENLQHARDLGLNNSIGSNNKMAKFTDEQVIEIRTATGLLKDIAAIYNAPMSVISRIRSLKAYTNVR